MKYSFYYSTSLWTTTKSGWTIKYEYLNLNHEHNQLIMYVPEPDHLFFVLKCNLTDIKHAPSIPETGLVFLSISLPPHCAWTVDCVVVRSYKKAGSKMLLGTNIYIGPIDCRLSQYGQFSKLLN